MLGALKKFGHHEAPLLELPLYQDVQQILHEYGQLDHRTLCANTHSGGLQCSTGESNAESGVLPGSYWPVFIYRVFRASVNRPEPECVYHEEDGAYDVSISRSLDKRLIFINSQSSTSNEMLYMRSDHPGSIFRIVESRAPNKEYSVEHWYGHLFMIKRTARKPNAELLLFPVDHSDKYLTCIPHRDNVKVEEIRVFNRHIAVLERANGLTECFIYPLAQPDESRLTRLQGSIKVSFDDEAYVLSFSSQDPFKGSSVNLYYSSMGKPGTWMSVDMETGEKTIKKVTEVRGGFVQDDYVTKRLWATSHDDVKVPISVVYNRHLVTPQRPAPCHLDAYGAYEVINEPTFSRNRISLLDRGIICAIVHARGGGELGRQWYEAGRMLLKHNTFLDVIAATEYLVQEGWTASDRIVLEGASAGGMTVCAVANMRPDLYEGIVAGVPFVDCLTTSSDESLPLVTQEYSEWGNPNAYKTHYTYIKSYSPVDNIKAQDYPHMLVTAGLHDSRVSYWEPAKFVAALRLVKTDSNILILKCDMGAGHFSQPGRFDLLKEAAFDMSFIITCLNRFIARF